MKNKIKITSRKHERLTTFILLALLITTPFLKGQVRAEYGNIVGITGMSCTAFGALSGSNTNISSGGNTGLGRLSFSNIQNGNNCTALGSESLFNLQSGDNNSASGYWSMDQTDNANANTASGSQSLYNNTSGRNNSAMGYLAGDANITGIENTAFGREADFGSSSANNQTSVGFQAVTSAGNMVRLGNTAITDLESQQALTVTSDGRLKFNLSETDVKGIEFIRDLRPVSYFFDAKKQTEHLTANFSKEKKARFLDHNFSQSSNSRRNGFLAQEVEKAAIKSGYNFDGIKKPSSDNDYYALNYSALVVPLVKCVQEQQVLLAQLEMQLSSLEEKHSEPEMSLMNFNSSRSSGALKLEPIIGGYTIRSFENIDAKKSQIACYNAVGQLVESKTLSSGNDGVIFTTAHFLPGLYYFALISENSVLATKVIKINM